MPTHLLVVDDEEDLFFMLKRKFKSRIISGEWVFYEACDGLEALEVITKEPAITLVLTDLNMPNLGGLALLEELQKREGLVQTIVVSAYGDMENIRVAMNRGAFDFIVKPINLADLETTILKTIDHISFLERVALDQKALARTRSELVVSQELANLKSQFFANVSHEFRTPLTLIVGPLQDMLRGDIGEFRGEMPRDIPSEIRRRLTVMHKHASRLSQLIDQLLDIARLEAGKVSLYVQQTDLVHFVNTRFDAFCTAAQQAGISLELLHEDEKNEVYIDLDLFEKIITNLLSNALKWTPEGGKIRLKTGRTSELVYIQVRDNGKGMPAEDLPYIFDRFYQVKTDEHQQTGTGIGLALTKELVSLHGGRIAVESESGFGSAFTVYVPLGSAHFDGSVFQSKNQPEAVAMDCMSASESFDEDTNVPESEYAVLVVEDQADVREYVGGVIKRYYRVLEASNGREALEILEKDRPALIISDVMMPEMDGFQLCEAIKKDDRFNHIPVILLTAKAEDTDRLEGLGLGADDYIVKPFNARELLVRAENLIAIRQMLQNKYATNYVMRTSEISIPSADEAFLEAVRIQIEAGMADSSFDVGQLADAVAVSPRQLRRRIRALTGLSTSGLVRSMRLQRAAQLLQQKAGTVSEVAYMVGFQQVKYFSRLFKQVYGVSPSVFG